METVIIFSIIMGFSCALVVAKYGLQLGFTDVPNDRSAHTRIIPRSGGIGIPVAVILVVWIWTGRLVPVGVIAGLALLLSIFSLIDDRKGLSVTIRFLTQFSLAVVIVWIFKGEFLQLVENEWGLVFVIGAVMVGAVFITATTNFFNFMDGINGIAGFMSLISFGLIGFYAIYIKEAPAVPVLCYAVFFSTLGYLPVNFPRARVFMGDVGSIFIGNLFAAVVVWQAGSIKEFILLLSFQGTLYIDCISTICLRFSKGENVLQAHNKHLYQRFVHQFKWSHTRTTLVYSLFQLLMGVVGLLLFKYSVIYLIILWVSMFLFYWLIRFRLKLT